MSEFTPDNLDEIDKALTAAWGSIRASSFTMSLNTLRKIIDKEERRVISNQEFGGILIRLQEAKKITFLDEEIVELHE